MNKVFRRIDLWAGLAAGLMALFVYVYTLMPDVGLEDSGELIAAAWNLGVPHPPGYPIWTLLAFLFSRIPVATVAWRVNFLSAFFGAVTVGFVTAIALAAVRVQLQSIPLFRDRLTFMQRERLGACTALAAGLMLTMSAGLWSQSVIAEVYSLNSFFFMAILALMFLWLYRPDRMWSFYLMIYLFGLGLTNHQTLVLLLPAFLPPIWMNDRRLFWQLASFGAALLGGFLWWHGLASTGVFGSLMPGETPHGSWLFGGVILLVLSAAFGWLSGARDSWVHPLLMLGWVVSLILLYYGLTGSRPEYIDFGEVNGIYGRQAPLIMAGLVFPIAFGIASWWYRERFRDWRAPYLSVFLLFLGLAFYLVMPILARGNPPLNWGYTHTVQGFWHHVRRGQYAQLNLERSINTAWLQLRSFWGDFQVQFGSIPILPFMKEPWLRIPYAVFLGLVTFLSYPWLGRRARSWFQFCIIAFFLQGLGFVFLNNPSLDIHSLFTQRVFFILCHCIFAIWLAGGMALILAWMVSRREVFLGMAPAIWRRLGLAGMGLIFLLPTLGLRGNWSRCEKRGHDFGHIFGYRMLENLPEGAILFGGTDPGRFVPLYFINTPSVDGKRFHPDVYLITQNALADQTYMKTLVDRYSPQSTVYSPDGNPDNDRSGFLAELAKSRCMDRRIWLPDREEMTDAFAKLVEESRRMNRVPGGGGVELDASGKVNVTGVGAVMKINEILLRRIWEENRDEHEFFVEESYVIPWMYPYLTPHGLIMRLNAAPLEGLSEEVVAEDFAYWDQLISELVDRPEYHRDEKAPQTFAKLRSSIGGLYLYWANRTRERKMYEHAERALRQALELYRPLPEANYRLAELLTQQDRQEDAMKVLDEYLEEDPLNTKIPLIKGRVQQSMGWRDEAVRLRARLDRNARDEDALFALARIYGLRNMIIEANAVVNQLLQLRSDTATVKKIIALYGELGRPNEQAQLMEEVVRRNPEDWRQRLELAAIYAQEGDLENTFRHMRAAVQTGGYPAREAITKDSRFDYLYDRPDAEKLFEGIGLDIRPRSVPGGRID
jgi:thioredoxin-like negative regulator of GroEL